MMMLGVEESSSRLDKFMYIFITCKGSYDYILYRIDAYKHLREPCFSSSSSSNTTTQQLHELQPLLVFTNSVLPCECICVKLQSNFYFLSRSLYEPFGLKDGGDERAVYMIRESDLMDLQPSEHNTDAQKYLTRIANLNVGKHNPIVFVAENKLYVFSSDLFEVYSPDLGTWRILPLRPPDTSGRPNSYVVVGQTVYFSFNEDVLSFHLDEEKWTHIPSAVCSRHEFNSLSPYKFPLATARDMAFWFFYEDEDIYDNWEDKYYNGLRRLTICAAPLPLNRDIISHEFMLPSIYPDDEFSRALNSSRCPYVTEKSLENFSDHIVALDGGKVLCLVSWGMKTLGRSFDFYTSYATLTFFKVIPHRIRARNVGHSNRKVDGNHTDRRSFKPKLWRCNGDFTNVKADGTYVAGKCFKAKLQRCSREKLLHNRGCACNVDFANEKVGGKNVAERCFKAKLQRCSNAKLLRRAHERNADFANEKAHGKYAARKCFKAKLLHSAHYIVKTNSLPTCGQIGTCL